MILSELIPFLERIGARPRKSLSQNFLVDPNVVKKIVATAEIQPGDRVLEIGPGPGALTQELLTQGATVFAVEKDPIFARELSRLEGPLHIFPADFLEFPLERLREYGPIKGVANLPYHITAPILEKICEHASLFSSFTVMIQKEVAERLAAAPSTKEFGSLTLFIEFFAKIGKPFTVSPGCFYPRPGVDSSVLRLDFHPTQPPVDPTALFTVIRRAFQQRRKMLRSSLQSLYPPARTEAALQAIGASPEARPETLSLEQWINFFASV